MRWLDARAPWIASAAAAIIIVVGIGYSIFLGPELRYWDEKEYLRIATELVRSGIYTLDGTTPTAFRPPGYPAFLAIGVALGMGIVGLRIAQFVLFGLTILLLYQVAARIWRPAAGAIAASLALLYPIFTYAAGTLYPQTLGSFLFLLALFPLARKQPPGLGGAAASGLIFGALILCIPTFVFSLGVVGLWLLLTYRQRAIAPCAVGIAAVLLVIGPWQVRNYRVFETPVFVATNSGLNLLIGNSENATSDSGVNADISRYEAEAVGMSEVERDHYFRDSAIAWMVDNPGRAAKLYVAKTLHYFSYRDRLATESESSSLRELVMLATYGPLLLLALVRLGAFRRYPVNAPEGLLIALFFSNALFMALFFTRLRFRIPMDFLLIAVVAGFLATLLRRREEGPSRA